MRDVEKKIVDKEIRFSQELQQIEKQFDCANAHKANRIDRLFLFFSRSHYFLLRLLVRLKTSNAQARAVELFSTHNKSKRFVHERRHDELQNVAVDRKKFTNCESLIDEN